MSQTLDDLYRERRKIINNISEFRIQLRQLRINLLRQETNLGIQMRDEDAPWSGYTREYSEDTINLRREVNNTYSEIDNINYEIQEELRLLEEIQINIRFHEGIVENREQQLDHLHDIATTALETIGPLGDESPDPLGTSTLRRFSLGDGERPKRKGKTRKKAKTHGKGKTRKRAKTQKRNKKKSNAKGIFSRMRKKFTNRLRRPHSMIQYSQEVLNPKLLNTALYGESPAEVRRLLNLGADPNATMYDHTVGEERSVIQIAHNNRYDYIVDILREEGVTEPLPLRVGKTFSRLSSIRPRSTRKSGRSVRFGKDSIQNIPKIGKKKTPSRMDYVSATGKDMSQARRKELDYLLMRGELASKRGF